jgi:phosphoglucomutase
MSGHKGLAKWFKQDWVDIGSKKKGGGFKKCGRSKQKADAKRKYPKCVPAAKAARMSESQRRSAVKRKRSKAQGVGGKPTNVKTFAKARGGLIRRSGAAIRVYFNAFKSKR